MTCGPRTSVSHLRRLQWLCNGASSGSLNALKYLRNNTFRKHKDEGMVRFQKIFAFLGAPDRSVTWRRVFEKEIDHPMMYSVNRFRTLGGYNSHYQHSKSRLEPLASLFAKRNKLPSAQYQIAHAQQVFVGMSEIWNFFDGSLSSNPTNHTSSENYALSINPDSLVSQIRRKFQSFSSQRDSKLRNLLLQDGHGDSLIHCIAAFAQFDGVFDAGLKILYSTTISDMHPMMWCIRSGDVDVNQRNDLGETALWQACAAGHVATATALLKAGANPDIPNTNGVTPLHWLFNFLNHEVDVLAAVFKASGATSQNYYAYSTAPAFHFPFEWPKGTPLHWAVCANSHRAVGALISLGADVNATVDIGDAKLMSALDIAVSRHEHALVKSLIHNGAHVRNSVKWAVPDDSVPLWLSHIPADDPETRRNKAFYTLNHLLRPYAHRDAPLPGQFPSHEIDECVDLKPLQNAIESAFLSQSHIVLHALGRIRSMLPLCCWQRVSGIDSPPILLRCIVERIPLPVFRWFTKGEIGEYESQVRDNLGATILHFSAGWSDPRRTVHQKYLWYLMENGYAMEEFVGDSKDTGLSMLMKNAAQDQQQFVLKVCRELTANPFYRDASPAAFFYLTGLLPSEGTGENPYGMTALHHALQASNLDAVKVLLENGHNPNTPTSEGLHPLDLVKNLDISLQGSFSKLLQSFGALQSSNQQLAWGTSLVGEKQCFHLENGRSVTFQKPGINPYAERYIILGWREGGRTQFIRVDQQRIFPRNTFLLPVISRSALDRNRKDPSAMHRVTPEQGYVLNEEKNDRLALHKLGEEEKFYHNWNRDLRMTANPPPSCCLIPNFLSESIYHQFSVHLPSASRAASSSSLSAILSDKKYEVTGPYPLGWTEDPLAPIPFYVSGVYNDLRGFKFVPERSALEQFSWEHLGEQLAQNPVEKTETGRQTLPARGVGRKLEMQVDDLKDFLSGPRTRDNLPLRLQRKK